MEQASDRRRSDEKLAALIEKERLIPPADLRALLDEIEARSGEGEAPPLARLIVERGYACEEEVRLLTERIRFRPGTPAVAAGFPRRLGAYELLEIIGSGAMGAVVKARQLHMDRIVALKILSGTMARDPGYVERFLREARAAGTLNHGNIVKVYEVGEAGGFYYFSMECVEGLTVGKLIAKRGRIPVREAMEVVDQIASALEHAEAHGIVHRDIKPDNIIVDVRGRARLADLGLAKRIAGTRAEGASPVPSARSGRGPLEKGSPHGASTRDGVTMGTPFYMSLEQARAPRKVDHRSDIYSLGATFYHMVTGRVPFDGDSAAEILTRAARDPLVRPERIRPGILPRVGELIGRMMAKVPEARFQSAAELRAEIRLLKKAIADGEAAAPPGGMLAVFRAPIAAGVGLVAVAALHALVSREESAQPPMLLPPPPTPETAVAAPAFGDPPPPPQQDTPRHPDPRDQADSVSQLAQAFVASGFARGVMMRPEGSPEREDLLSEILAQARAVEERARLLFAAGAFDTAGKMLGECEARWKGISRLEETARRLREDCERARGSAEAERRRLAEYERLSAPAKELAAERRYGEASESAHGASGSAPDAQVASALKLLADDYASLEQVVRAMIKELNSPGRELPAVRYLDDMYGGFICGADREWIRVRLYRRMETAKRWSSLTDEEFLRLVEGVARARSERWKALLAVVEREPGRSPEWARRRKACETLDRAAELLDRGEARRAARLLWEEWGAVGKTRRALAALQLASAARPFHCRAVEVYPGRSRLFYGFDSFEEVADWSAGGTQLTFRGGAIESPGGGESFLKFGPMILGDLELELAWTGGPMAVTLSLEGSATELPRVEEPHVLRLRTSPEGSSWRVEGTELKGELRGFLLTPVLWITMKGSGRLLAVGLAARFGEGWLAETLARRERKARGRVRAALGSGSARSLAAAGLEFLDHPELAARAWNGLAAAPGDPDRASKARAFARALLDLPGRKGENRTQEVE